MLFFQYVPHKGKINAPKQMNVSMKEGRNEGMHEDRHRLKRSKEKGRQGKQEGQWIGFRDLLRPVHADVWTA